MECAELIAAGERGVVMPCAGVAEDGTPVGRWVPMHLECYLRGTASHQYEQCGCYVPGRSVRDEARATLVAINADRAEQGMGPL